MPVLTNEHPFFPALFVGFYYIAFGQTDEGMATYLSILVVKDDTGAAAAVGGRWQAGADLIEVIRGAEWEGNPIFDVEVVTDRRAAEIALRERKVSLLLAIPHDFTRTLMEGVGGIEETSPATASLVGDPGSDWC